MKTRFKPTVALWLLATASLCSTSGLMFQGKGADGQAGDQQVVLRSLGVPFPVSPADNPITSKKISLGRELFFDKRLSRDNSISCATCHEPKHGFSDPHPVSIGVNARTGDRNSMSLLNVAFFEPLMWDGRAKSLEEQALLPFAAHFEFDLPVVQAVAKLRRHGYSEKFKEAFGEDISEENLAKALAAYQRSLLAGDSPFDRYILLNDSQAISPAAQRGFEVFLKARCDACHLIMTPGLHPFALRYILFTDNKFHNIGVGMDKEDPDPGRFAVTGDPNDWGAFRTPSLRNIALTAPYFHDGSARTLFDVVEFYDRGGIVNRNLDPAMRPLKLSQQQKRDLVAFLESLTSSRASELAHEEAKVRQTATATSSTANERSRSR